MKKSIAVYPTSADPPTLGHADVLQRAAQKFDLVYWVAANNPYKKPSFTFEQRLAMMNFYIVHLNLKNVMIDMAEGAVIRFAQAKGAGFLLRGLRNATDFQSEIELSTANHHIEPGIETFCIFANPKYSTISSSLVREFARLGEDFNRYVIPPVAEIIRQVYTK